MNYPVNNFNSIFNSITKTKSWTQKQTDTIAKLTPKPKKLSRKERKAKEAKEQKHQNYLKDSKDVYPEFNQRTDSVVTTKGHIRSVIQAHNRMKAKLATLPPVSLKPGEGVKSVPVFGPIDYNKEKLFKDRKTGEYISKMIVKKGTGKRLNKKKY